MAVRAHDVVALALRGQVVCLNFADSMWGLPIPASNELLDICKATVEVAETFGNVGRRFEWLECNGVVTRDTAAGGLLIFRRAFPSRQLPRLRPVAFNLTDFGGVGDGVTLNTAAFERAVMAISKLGKKGGGQLNVPQGNWLTAPFNLTSHMTLFLAEGAVILGIDDEKYWPLLPPLPSYGYGREHPGPRYGSLIHGQHLKDVVITGQRSNQGLYALFLDEYKRMRRGVCDCSSCQIGTIRVTFISYPYNTFGC
ncbi:hypothetical protein DH2020_026559 [Rehmannia glutinosa]|uniref:Pectate lyase superfamily protein domain-containing protein n=1 Tax=Rehmannia glutinosa TaxID=99300 RepID=A0ABR0VZH3_REHGL